MDSHIATFSDIVIQKSLEKIKYLEFLTDKAVKVFHFDENEAFFIGLKSESIN